LGKNVLKLAQNFAKKTAPRLEENLVWPEDGRNNYRRK
jgi:hypothetical protein